MTPRGGSARVVVVDLGRQKAMGARRRVGGLAEMLEAGGFEAVVLQLLPTFRASPLDALRRVRSAVVSSSVVPETLSWSPIRVHARLEELQPDVVICVTSRSFHPALLKGPWDVYIDFVDRLSVSYRDRAGMTSGRLRGFGYRGLGRSQHRFEEAMSGSSIGGFAAGLSDADALGVDWLPNNADQRALTAEVSRAEKDFDIDIAFVGTLDYPPNVGAVLALDAMWPSLIRRRPSMRGLLAGARPTKEVAAAAARRGWCLLPDFDSAEDIYRRTRIAVAPLPHASGIQNKVLDAAAYAVPQIVSPAVADGLDEHFPVIRCTNTAEWVEEIVALLEDPSRARELGARSRRHLAEVYGTDAGAQRLRRLLTSGIR